MDFKKDGLLERITNTQEGVCASCANLVRFTNKNVLACAAHDKLIMPRLMPYIHGNNPCEDWKKTSDRKVGET